METMKLSELKKEIYPVLCEIGFENCYSCGNLCEDNDYYCHVHERTMTDSEMEKGCEHWDTVDICPPGYMQVA